VDRRSCNDALHLGFEATVCTASEPAACHALDVDCCFGLELLQPELRPLAASAQQGGDACAENEHSQKQRAVMVNRP
tara:strand:+ start:933 stop:1163 length:231 start_codon:yes stop_codon:yes gene_type:complete